MRLRIALLAFACALLAPIAARATCGSTVPYIFVNGVNVVDASTTNTNNSFLVTCVTTIDNTQVGPAGFFASQIIPTSVATAIFGNGGGFTAYRFPTALTVGPSLTFVSGLNPGDFDIAETSNTGLMYFGANGTGNYAQFDWNITHSGMMTLAGTSNSNPVGLVADGGINSVDPPSAYVAVASAGDMQVARSSTKGLIMFGGAGASGSLDFGVTTGAVFTSNVDLDALTLRSYEGTLAGGVQGFVPPVFSMNGNQQGGGEHIVSDNVTLQISASTACSNLTQCVLTGASGTYHLSNKGAFTGPNSYGCWLTPQSNNAANTYANAQPTAAGAGTYGVFNQSGGTLGTSTNLTYRIICEGS